MEHVSPPLPTYTLRTSESFGQLAEALAGAQGEFPAIEKNQTGRIEGEGRNGAYKIEYTYADIADVLAAVRPILAKHKIAVIQPTMMDRGNLVILTRLIHGGTGEWMESEYPVSQIGAKHQAMGGALTYARRYALCSLLGIAAEEDKDGDHVAAPESRHARQHQERPQQHRRQERPQQPKPEETIAHPQHELTTAEKMVDSIKKRVTPSALNNLTTSQKWAGYYAELKGEDKTWVDAVLKSQQEAVDDPTADTREPTPPADPLPTEDQARQKPRQESEPAPAHTPGRLSQAALRTVQQNLRQPSRAGDLIDDDLPF